MIGQTLPAILIVLVLALWPLALPPERRGRIWLRQGLIWFGVVGGFIMLFIIGETFTDPGGLEAVTLVSLWVVPAALLAWLALARPVEARITLTAMCSLSTAFNIWAVAVGTWWWRFENDHGPISAIITFATTIPLGFMAWRQPWLAGWLLIATTVLPDLAVLVRNPERGGTSLGFLTSPGLVAGVLFVLAGYAQRKQPGGLTAIRGMKRPEDYPDIPGSSSKAA